MRENHVSACGLMHSLPLPGQGLLCFFPWAVRKLSQCLKSKTISFSLTSLISPSLQDLSPSSPDYLCSLKCHCSVSLVRVDSVPDRQNATSPTFFFFYNIFVLCLDSQTFSHSWTTCYLREKVALKMSIDLSQLFFPL